MNHQDTPQKVVLASSRGQMQPNYAFKNVLSQLIDCYKYKLGATGPQQPIVPTCGLPNTQIASQICVPNPVGLPVRQASCLMKPQVMPLLAPSQPRMMIQSMMPYGLALPPLRMIPPTN